MFDPRHAYHLRWQKLYRHCFLIIALTSLCACGSNDQAEAIKSRDGKVRTIKVLSTRDDSPVPGVNVEVRAVATLGESGPITDKRVWYLTTDAAGEIRVTPPAGTRLEVYVSGKPGFTVSNANIKYYEKHLGPKSRAKSDSEQDTHYLTPTADVDYEWVRYSYRAASDVIDGKVKVSTPITYLVDRYFQAKEHAKTPRELTALRDFCRFSDLVKTEAANEWPTLGTADFLIMRGRMLIDDCAAEPPEQ